MKNNKFIEFICLIINSFVLGFTFGIGIIFSFIIIGLTILNIFLPKIKEMILNL